LGEELIQGRRGTGDGGAKLYLDSRREGRKKGEELRLYSALPGILHKGEKRKSSEEREKSDYVWLTLFNSEEQYRNKRGGKKQEASALARN